MPTIAAIPVLTDNYSWAIHGIDATRIIIVDPGEAKPILNYLAKNNLKLDAILLTHHHWDHTGGVQSLLSHFPDIAIYGSKLDEIPGITHFIKENEVIILENLSAPIHILAIPGHTLGHIAFLYENALFCGDTLFSVGMGKIFEGTATQMYASIEKIKNLPPHTLIYCGHEYTLANIRFAQTLDPDNTKLSFRKSEVEKLISKNLPSLPALLRTELEINPFLRCDKKPILSALKNKGYTGDHAIAALLFLRELKNKF